jgi:hypothetical protein
MNLTIERRKDTLIIGRLRALVASGGDFFVFSWNMLQLIKVFPLLSTP